MCVFRKVKVKVEKTMESRDRLAVTYRKDPPQLP